MKQATSDALQGAIRDAISRRFVERQASRIADPIERLQFLRRLEAPLPQARGRRLRVFYWAVGLVTLALSIQWITPVSRTAPQPGTARTRRAGPAASPAGDVWLVEETRDAELYSNGLRVERRYLTESEPRNFLAFARSGKEVKPEQLAGPAGIVFHASESELAPFEPGHAKAVRRQGQGLLDWVRSKRLYHYVVDRIGRVHHVVKDDQRADHAGNSVWADANRIYVNLNNSFIGVAFEARTEADMEPAQMHAGRVLVDMLRSRYGIAPENCVTHAQVSVNPGNYRVGYHTDWISNFPFRSLGLGDNYDRPMASLILFGFSYDPGYLETAAAPLRESVLRSEQRVRLQAEAEGSELPLYQRSLRARFQQLRAAIVPQKQESLYGN